MTADELIDTIKYTMGIYEYIWILHSIVIFYGVKASAAFHSAHTAYTQTHTEKMPSTGPKAKVVKLNGFLSRGLSYWMEQQHLLMIFEILVEQPNDKYLNADSTSH